MPAAQLKVLSEFDPCTAPFSRLEGGISEPRSEEGQGVYAMNLHSQFIFLQIAGKDRKIGITDMASAEIFQRSFRGQALSS